MEPEPPRAEIPYPPSWVDRVAAAIDRSRVPAWAVYAFVAALSIVVFVAADIASAAFPLGNVLPFHAFLAALPVLNFWFIVVLDRVAGRALDQAAPVLKDDETQRAQLRYQLTTMPAVPVFLLTVLGALSIPPILLAIFELDPTDAFLAILGVTRTTASLGAFVLFIGLSYAIGFVFLYHTARQLRLVSRIYTEHVVVDLADLGPVYALSRVSALTAAGIQLQSVMWILTNPAAGGAFLPTAFLIALTFVSAVVFVVPLWGIHQRIADEKSLRLSTTAMAREMLMAELREGVVAHDLARATQIKDAVLAFEVQAKALASVRTWPWEPETLRLLLTAVLLPTVLFVLQYLLRLLLPA